VKSGLIVRAVGVVVLALIGWQVGSLLGSGSEQVRHAILGISIGAIVGLVAAPIIIGRPYRLFVHLASRTPLLDLLVGIIGLILGLIVAALLAYPLSFLPYWLGHTLPAIAAVTCAYLGITLFLTRKREITSFVQGRFGHSEAPATGPGPILVDTSSIIDGRILDLAQTGFLRGTLLVPRFVLVELQHVADSPDPLKRNRGRRGLEILNRLQKESTAPVEISDADARDIPDVDSKLVKLGRQMDCPIITNDYNLNRVAELQGVTVLNVNELANALKPVVLPGEEMAVRIIQEGKEYNQGVGYLDDGTMIVVENGRAHLHQEIDIVVTRVLQTVAGRMIFAQPRGTLRE
jgi:uncharacterized protein YacL